MRVSTRSVAVTPGWSALWKRTPTTTGVSRKSGWPSRQASASIPPTPQPSTPMPLTIGVWESVPTRVSGRATRRPSCSRTATTEARYSRFTWCTMPIPGGTTRNPWKACCAQRRSSYRSWLRSYSRSMFAVYACAVPKELTWTEWSTTRSAGTSGSTREGSPFARTIAARIAARSTTAGTPVKSWRSTRAGVNGRSRSSPPGAPPQRASASTSPSATSRPPAWRSRFSRRILSVTGNPEGSPKPRPASRSSRYTSTPSTPPRAARAPYRSTAIACSFTGVVASAEIFAPGHPGAAWRRRAPDQPP